MKIVYGNSHPALAKSLAQELDQRGARVQVQRFPDQEICIEVHESLQGEDVFVVQFIAHTPNERLMELFLTIDALVGCAARRITVCLPYFCYARQDRPSGVRQAIAAKLIVQLLIAAGANHILTIDLHGEQVQDFSQVPVDNLSARALFVRDIQDRFLPHLPLIVAPDAGGGARACYLANALGTDHIVLQKQRFENRRCDISHVNETVKGRECILVDDIIDSGNTLCQSAESLIKGGAARVTGYVTHGLFSGGALERVRESVLDELVITDSIPLPPLCDGSFKVRVVSVAPLLGQAISSIHTGSPIPRALCA